MIKLHSKNYSPKKIRTASLIIYMITLFLLSYFLPTHTIYAAVVINELYPKTEPVTQEWIELYNNGSESVSLDRWSIQNSNNEGKPYILNASWIIASHGFLTFNGSQTGIAFSIGGDSVHLFNEKGDQVDSQSYPDILGYNTSMGRSSDGDGVWTICSVSTYNLPNICPMPSPVATLMPTEIPEKIPTPLPTTEPDTTSFPIQQNVVSPLSFTSEKEVYKTVESVSPTPTPNPENFVLTINKNNAFLILFVLFSWIVIASVAYFRKKR